MRQETPEQPQPLRSGYTTGACATATCYAAASACLNAIPLTTASITIRLPRGQQVAFELTELRQTNDGYTATTIKDAGDDPDVTHRAAISAHVSLTPTEGVTFHPGEGVGTVTRAGLPIPVGEAAINPVPRRMMTEHLTTLAEQHQYTGGFRVTIAVENGRQLAEKTLNPRLGIIGGISILGTTGIVRPFSCSAYIASIHRGIDVAIANGATHLAACTGSTSEASVQQIYPLPEHALIDMCDFAGAVIKYLRRHPVPRLTLCGGFGKLTKLACGHLDLHSRSSQIDFHYLARTAKRIGADDHITSKIESANTSLEALSLLPEPLQQRYVATICEDATQTLRKWAHEETTLEVIAINRQGTLLGRHSE